MEIVALMLMFATIGVKALTSQMISRMKYKITHVVQIKQDSLKRLKAVQSQHAVFNQSKTMLTAKKTKTTKRLNRLKKEMASFSEAQKTRKQIATIRKVDRQNCSIEQKNGAGRYIAPRPVLATSHYRFSANQP